MPVEIAPGDGEYLKRVGSLPVGADAEQLAADIDSALAANVVDTETAVGAALNAQFVTVDSVVEGVVDVTDEAMAAVVEDDESDTRVAVESVIVNTNNAQLPFRLLGPPSGDSTGDADTGALKAAISALEATGGTVGAALGVYYINDEIELPDGVSLVGSGSTGGTREATTFVCVHADAKIHFVDKAGAGNRGGLSGNFLIEGDGIANGPLLDVGLCVQRSFTNINVANSAGIGWRVRQAQNCLFQCVESHDSATVNFVLDEGAGGNLFQRCEFDECAGWQVQILNTSTSGPYGALGPVHNKFDHCIFERGSSGALEGCIDIHAGLRNHFADCIFASGANTINTALVRSNNDDSTAVETTFSDCLWIGNGSGVGIIQTGGGVYMYGRIRFQNLTDAWQYDGGSGVVWTWPAYASVTNRWSGAGTVSSRPGTMYGRPITTTVETNDGFAFRAVRQGDSAFRWQVTDTGILQWMDGSSFTADTTLSRASANMLTTGSGDSFRCHTGAWDSGHLLLGAYHIWVDTSGALRIKNGAPSSDTDGTVVGTQT